MKKFLFVTNEGGLLDMAYKVKNEGHSVKMFVKNKKDKETGNGFVKKSKDWEIDTEWADIIIFESIGNGKKIDELRKKGKLIIGGTEYTDKLENDRNFGQSELKRHGIKILGYNEFDDFDNAIKFIKENPGKYVLKPSGEIQDLKQLLFVGNEEHGGDVIRILTAYKKTWGKDMKEFQLQQKVSGVEIGVGAFFNGKKFIMPININFEHKKLFPGELGVSTGEMGTTMFWSEENKIFDKTLKKIENTLAESGYIGYIDLNCIVNGSGIYPLEFTCRFGYPTISIQQGSIKGDISDFLINMVNGKDTKIKTKSGFHIGVILVVPPFPFYDKKTFDSFSKDSVIIFKEKPKNLEGFHLQEIKLVNDEWLICGPAGIALIVTGAGLTMKQAQKQVYGRINNILIANMYYRNDIGNRWSEDSDKLRGWNYI